MYFLTNPLGGVMSHPKMEGDDGAGNAGDDQATWRDTFLADSDLKDAAALQDIPDIPTLAKNHVDLQTHLGNSIRIPGEDASDEQWAEFNSKLSAKVPGLMMKPDFDDPKAMENLYTSLGRPEKPEEYKYEDPPKGVQVNNQLVENFRQVAHKAGLSAKQFQTVVNEMVKGDIERGEALKDQQAQNAKVLFDEWGHAYDQNYAAVKSIAERTGAPEQLQAALQQQTVDAQTVKWLHSIAKAVAGDGGNMFNDPANKSNVMTPTEAQGKIDDIMGNKKHAYWDDTHPGHARALKQMIELRKFADPNAGTDFNDLRAGGSA